MGKKQTTKQKALKGTLQKCRTNSKEPMPIIFGKIKPPTYLTAKAKKAFLELARITNAMHILSEGDSLALAMLCDAWAEYRDARDFVHQNGSTYKTTNKLGDIMFRARPEVAIASDAYKRVRGLLNDFGLTPAARAKVNSEEADDDVMSNYFETK